MFCGWKWNNVPQWAREQYQAARKRLFNWEKIKFVLLDGHPTRAQLAAGIGKRGHPVSIYNVQCDKLCGETAENHLRRLEESKPAPGPDLPELHPLVNTSLVGEGTVVAHERVRDSLGKFHGLYRLTIQGEADYPDMELWQGMMRPDSMIEGVVRDPLKACRLAIYYRGRNDHPAAN